MKRLAIILFSMLLLAGAVGAGITNTPHDLSSLNTGNAYHSTNQDQICIFCHTPHFASTAQKPLWNRTDPTNTYETYWSPTVNAYTQVNTPDVSGVSLQCLSCHDGVVALNSLLYTGSVGTPTMTFNQLTGTANLNDGANGLTNDHPVSFDYGDAAAADAELVAEGSLPSWALIDGKVQCSSCHDVHNYGGTAAMQPFMNDTKTGSAICLQCHEK